MSKTRTLSIALFIIVCLLTAYSVTRISGLKRDIRVLENNLECSADSINTLTMQNGEVVQWNKALVVDNDALKQLLEDENLSKKEIEKSLNAKIRALTTIISQFSSDTIVMNDTVVVVPDSAVVAPFGYRDEYLSLKGSTLFKTKTMTSETTVTDLTVRVPLMLGLTDQNQIFVKTDNKSVDIQMMNTVKLEDKPCRRLGIGIYTGFGVSYGLLDKRLDLGPQFGIGATYRIF